MCYSNHLFYLSFPTRSMKIKDFDDALPPPKKKLNWEQTPWKCRFRIDRQQQHEKEKTRAISISSQALLWFLCVCVCWIPTWEILVLLLVHYLKKTKLFLRRTRCDLLDVFNMAITQPEWPRFHSPSSWHYRFLTVSFSSFFSNWASSYFNR